MDVSEGDGKSISRAEVLRRRAQLHWDRSDELAKLNSRNAKIMARNERLMARRCERKLEREIECPLRMEFVRAKIVQKDGAMLIQAEPPKIDFDYPSVAL